MPEATFVSPATTAKAQGSMRMRMPGSNKKRAVRVMRPALRHVQTMLRKNRRALAAAKPGSPLAVQLKAHQVKITTYLNSLHGKA